MSSKLKMLWTISKNKEMLESNGLNKKIVPVLIVTTKSSPIDEDGYVWIDGNSISVYSKSSDRVKPAITKKVNWQATLQNFVSMVSDKGLELVFIGKKDEERIAKDFKPGEARSELRHGVLSGIDEDMDPKLTNADSDAKQILTDYHKILQEKRVKIPFRLKPMVVTRKGVKSHSEYYFSEPMIQRPLNIRNEQHKAVSGNAWKELMNNIRWMDTFTSLLNGLEEIEHYLNHEGDHDENPLPMDEKEASAYINEKKQDKVRCKNLEDNLAIINGAIIKSIHDIKPRSIEEYEHDDQTQKLHDTSEAAFKEYGEALTRLEEAKKVVKSSNSKPARSALRAATSAMKATKAVYISKFQRYNDALRDNEKREHTTDDSQSAGSEMLAGGASPAPIRRKLKGRGLRGAGVTPLEGVVRRSRTYNLNEIQGLATPSAYVYRQLGSKYIQIADLDSKTLVIVQPNRRKCGPKREISTSLQALIRTLAFNQQIDQATYDKLSIDDKKLFKEMLAITHLQYNFHDRLDDPLESLKAEYYKLKGELELGNDNPSIIKQLKSLSVDMYSNRLISDSEFKDIIVRLI